MNRLKLTLGILTLAMGALFAVAPAGAQVYQPGPTTTTAAPSGPQSGGTRVKGETFTNTICGFAPGSTVNLSVDGQAGPSATADGNGCVAITTTIVSNSSVRVNGVTFNAACGPNSVIGTGPGASGGSFSQTDSFTINCSTTTGVATPTSSSGGGLAFTGANVLKLSGAAGLLVLFGAGLVAAERRKSRLQG